MSFLKAGYEKLLLLKRKIRIFLGENIEVTSSRKSNIISAIVTFVCLAVVVIFADEYTSQEFAAKWWLLGFSLLAPFIIGIAIKYTVRIKNNIFNTVWNFVLLFLMPILIITMTECLNNIFIYNMTYLGFLGNYLVVIIFLFLVYAISGSFKIAYFIVTPILFGFGIAHSYLMDFRGTPFLPMDFLSITTAVGVANTYSFAPTYKIIIATLIFIFIIVFAVKIQVPKLNILTKVISRSFVSAFSTIMLLLFFGTSVFANMGVRPDFWNQTRGYKNYGFVFSFFCNTKYLYMSEPDNYNPGDIGGYVSHVVGEDEPTIKPNKDAPNIICIMNESLADLQVLGQFQTNEDYMPFMRSLTENTIKGNCYVPVIGAGTSNTEFEFLTGHTTAFLPSGSNAYMLYVKNPIASLVSTMESQGYSSYALHPYYAAGWRRTEVYSNFGFNKFISLEDIIDVSLMKQYQENGNNPDYLQSLIDQYYPNSNMLLRQYVSDSYNYKLLIDDFESRDKSRPYFAFNVTMQNHGGYTTSASNFNEGIYTTSLSKSYNKVNKYLSLVKASDDAFKELIAYFSKVKEPTIICMFGDHHPSVETDFVAEVMGVTNLSGLSSEQEQARHATPFFIWANYDIEEQYIDKLSVNYLSSLVLKTAGVELTNYNKYLLDLSKILPVIDTVGYVDNNGVYYKWSEVSPYSGILDEYEKIQYNNIFDQQNVDSKIFYINGYVPQATEITDY